MGLTEVIDRRGVGTAERRLPLCSRPAKELMNNFFDCFGEQVDLNMDMFHLPGKIAAKICVKQMLSQDKSLCLSSSFSHIESVRKTKAFVVVYKDFSQYAYANYTSYVEIDRGTKKPVLLGFYAIVIGDEGVTSILRISYDDFKKNQALVREKVFSYFARRNLARTASSHSKLSNKNTVDGNEQYTKEAFHEVCRYRSILGQTRESSYGPRSAFIVPWHKRSIHSSGLLEAITMEKKDDVNMHIQKIDPLAPIPLDEEKYLQFLDEKEFIYTLSDDFFHNQSHYSITSSIRQRFFTLYVQYVVTKCSYPICKAAIQIGCGCAIVNHIRHVHHLIRSEI